MPIVYRIDMSRLTVRAEEKTDRYRGLGGRALTSSIVADEVPAECHPLSADNKLVIAPGILTGTGAPCAGRLSIGAKSPLTGGIKEANSGGMAALALAALDVQAIVLEGQPADKGLYRLVVTASGIRIERVDEFKGAGNYSNGGKPSGEVRRQSGLHQHRPGRRDVRGRGERRGHRHRRASHAALRPRRYGCRDGLQGREGDRRRSGRRAAGQGGGSGGVPRGDAEVQRIADEASADERDAAQVRHQHPGQRDQRGRRLSDAQLSRRHVRGRRVDQRRAAARHDPGAATARSPTPATAAARSAARGSTWTRKATT